MDGSVIIVTVLSGLCFLPARFSCLYILVEEKKLWTEAQKYCRAKYTDLASVHTEQDLAQLNDLVRSYGSVWIGLHTDADAWRWSLESQNHYGEGEAGFRMWAPGEPNGGSDQCQLCVAMGRNGEWMDQLCSHDFFSICYNGTVGAADTSSSFVPVFHPLTWEMAQAYCRVHYSDLASVRNQAENFQVQSLTTDTFQWIGLHRDTWIWSDGSSLAFSNWDPSAPLTCQKSCAVSLDGKWFGEDCDSKHSFVCYSAPQVKKQVVRVVLKKTDSSVDKEELKEGLLQKFNQRLMAHGLSEHVKLKWVKQPDGKVFHSVFQEEEKEEKEKSCDTDF